MPRKSKTASKTKVVEVVKVVKAKPKIMAQSSGSGSTGSKIGSSIGSKLGGWVGDLASKALGVITGFGDYEVKENTITQKMVGAVGVPSFLSAGGCCRLSHREFLGSVVSPGSAFTLTPYFINPFNSTTFPWLSEISGSFETYRIRGMIVEFVSTYGDAVGSSNAALGSVILATQYNTASPAFTSQLQMENYQFATSSKPSISMIHPIECDPTQLPLQHLYVFPATQTDPRWTHYGVTYLATVGQQAAAVLGELWVSYDIEFYQPKLLASVSSNALGAHYEVVMANASSWNNGTCCTGLFSPTTRLSGDMVLGAFQNSGFTLPPGLLGSYLVLYYAYASGTVTGAPGPASAGGSVVTNGSPNLMFPVTNTVPPTSQFTAGSDGSTINGTGLGAVYMHYYAFTASPSLPSLSCTINYGPTFTGGWTTTGSSALRLGVLVMAVPFNN